MTTKTTHRKSGRYTPGKRHSLRHKGGHRFNGSIYSWFELSRRAGNKQLGGKGKNLAELVSIGMPVPDGCTVQTKTYFNFLRHNNLRGDIKLLISNCDLYDEDHRKATAEEIRRRIINAEVPSAVREEIIQAYQTLMDGDDTGLVAVRSSATAEDQPDAAFAGAQSTFTNVHGLENVVRAVVHCWASLFNDRAILYRYIQGYDHLSAGLAVVIQKMVKCKAAGTAFTINPSSFNPDEYVIEAGFGQGEAVVGGLITPARYVLDNVTGKVSYRRHYQEIWHVHNPEATMFEKANKEEELPEHLRNKRPLTEGMVRKLGRYLKIIHDHYGVPMDVEFAISVDDELYFTQARPVTKVNNGASKHIPDKLPKEPQPLIKLRSGDIGSQGVAYGKVVILRTDPAGKIYEKDLAKVEKGCILVAKLTDPDIIREIKLSDAVVTDQGGVTSHAAITTRELRKACIVGTGNARAVLKKYEGKYVTVSALGKHIEIFEGRAETRIELGAMRMEAIIDGLRTVKDLHTKTKIGITLSESEFADQLAEFADYNGLVRMEALWQLYGKHPQYVIDNGLEEEAIEFMANILISLALPLGVKEMVVRLVDFKTVEMSQLLGGILYELIERNPMLGFRGAARYLKRPNEFNLEIRILLKAREVCPNIMIMVPFARTPEESLGVADMLAEHDLINGVNGFKLYLMAEIPSLDDETVGLFVIDQHGVKRYAGLSIGSNDLLQMLFGRDRDNEEVAHVVNENHKIFLMKLKKIIDGGHALGMTVSICGQAPSNHPKVLNWLIRCGIDGLALSYDTIEEARRQAHFEEELMARRPLLRKRMLNYCKTHGLDELSLAA